MKITIEDSFGPIVIKTEGDVLINGEWMSDNKDDYIPHIPDDDDNLFDYQKLITGGYEAKKHFNSHEFRKGSIKMACTPVIGMPIMLQVFVNPAGDMMYNWQWIAPAIDMTSIYNQYLHVDMDDISEVNVTDAMCDTISGLFSGRIKTKEGFKIAIGATVQDICPINLAKEEDYLGHKIALNRINTSNKN